MSVRTLFAQLTSSKLAKSSFHQRLLRAATSMSAMRGSRPLAPPSRYPDLTLDVSEGLLLLLFSSGKEDFVLFRWRVTTVDEELNYDITWDGQQHLASGSKCGYAHFLQIIIRQCEESLVVNLNKHRGYYSTWKQMEKMKINGNWILCVYNYLKLA